MSAYVIWDMNGTLIDDVAVAVKAVNDGFFKVGIKPTFISEYRENMDMPIYKYYEKHADLKKIPMSFFSKEYLDGYERYADLIKEGENALFCVRELHKRGVFQCVVSSFEQGRLLALSDRFGFTPFMDGVYGAGDVACVGKTERGVSVLREKGVSPENALVVGDMAHDFEMAQAMGARCLLYSKGHQSERALLKCGAPVINDLREVLNYV